MNSFEWNQQFITGIEIIDNQHQELVSMVNDLGTALTENNWDKDLLEDMLKGLTNYTLTHFETEEALMKKVAVNSSHMDEHIISHENFVTEIAAFSNSIDFEHKVGTKALFEYLVHWLVYHILGTDQDMARQVKAIENGESPDKAYKEEKSQLNNSTELLLAALHGLFNVVSHRNKELSNLNQTLEDRVAERTKELMEANEALEVISVTDHLTGLPNRRFAMRQLSLFFEESQTLNSPLSCLMIDLDKFKFINDTYGHDAGDIVLQQVARELQNSVRSDDLVCRLGGDEFIAICPHTDQEGAIQIGEQIRKIMSAMKIRVADSFWYGSVSIGVGTTNNDTADIDQLIKSADEAVYMAKNDGRNCLRVQPGKTT